MAFVWAAIAFWALATGVSVAWEATLASVTSVETCHPWEVTCHPWEVTLASVASVETCHPWEETCHLWEETCLFAVLEVTWAWHSPPGDTSDDRLAQTGTYCHIHTNLGMDSMREGSERNSLHALQDDDLQHAI